VAATRARSTLVLALALIAGFLGAALLVIFADDAAAEVLPEDRAEVMYHSYSGGGVEVVGPAVFLRRGIGENLSFNATWYQDTVSGASPDVLATASPWSDQRDELDLGVDWLRGDAQLSAAISHSEEDDYRADGLRLSLAREVFGGMSTLSLGYSGGSDRVGRIDDDNFDESVDRHAWKLGLAQVLTPRALLNLDYEIVSERGFLANPYRSKRILGAFAGPEVYPGTRTSYALAARSRYYLRPGRSLFGGYRYFSDSWDIAAHNLDFGLRTPAIAGGNLEVYYHHYRQSAASFYSDDFQSEQTYMARDKELATYVSNSFGVRADYRLFAGRYGFQRGRLRVGLEYSRYDYDDYSDATDPAGDAYSFDANIAHLSFTGTF